MTRLIIGLVGPKGSGKSTAFRILQGVLPTAQEIMLAGHLKRTCAEVFGLEVDDFNDPARKESFFLTSKVLGMGKLEKIYQAFGMPSDFTNIHVANRARPHLGKELRSPREIAQYVGTEVLRSVSENIHCQLAYELFREAPSSREDAGDLGVDVNASLTDAIGIVTDIRFPNEFWFFSACSDLFVPLYISRPECEERLGEDCHESESYFPKLRGECLAVVENSGSLEDFAANLHRAVLQGVLPAFVKRERDLLETIEVLRETR